MNKDQALEFATLMRTEYFSKLGTKVITHDDGCSGEIEERVSSEDGVCLGCKEHSQGVTDTCECGADEGDEVSECCGVGIWTP